MLMTSANLRQRSRHPGRGHSPPIPTLSNLPHRHLTKRVMVTMTTRMKGMPRGWTSDTPWVPRHQPMPSALKIRTSWCRRTARERPTKVLRPGCVRFYGFIWSLVQTANCNEL